jgi:5-dehydro-2-deoxygluconokinase
MLTRVGDEHMGRFVRQALASEGVDVAHVRTDPHRLTGLVLLGVEGPDRCPHIFYRENCADMGLCADDVEESHIASSHALAITGTHLSTPGVRAAAHKAIAIARAHDRRVILDIDYRPVLWGLVGHGAGAERFSAAAEVTRQMQAVLPDCHLVVGTEEEIRIAGGGETLLDALRAIRARTTALIVMKRGPAGCTLFPGKIPARLEGAQHVEGFRVDVLNVLGAGDAFLGGFLSGWLQDVPLERCGQLGNASGALVVTRHGCTPAMPTRAELDEYLARAGALTRPDEDARIGELHRATLQRSHRGELCILAFDHRRQLEQIAGAAGVTLDRVRRFKELVATALASVGARRNGAEQLGAIVDDRYGAAALARLGGEQWWIGRPVEIPASRPVEFEPRAHPGLHLLSWPRHHVVKCLVNYHPSDPIGLRLEQECRLRELHADTQQLERELLVELICSGPGREIDDETTANVLRRLYNLGIRPAWWKLEPQSEAAWREITAVIAEQDPLCHGVVLLGLDASEEALARSFETAAPFPICRGFAVGRTIFGAAARDWINGALEDQAAIDCIAEAYERVIELWRRGRPVPAGAY